jgi:3'(2'), 5'-bisphosphate nucleotidase
MPLFTDLQLPLIQLAKQAGKAILDIYQQAHVTSIIKIDHSPVTQADLLANTIIQQGLRQLTPNIPILSEEETPPSWEERQNWTYHWLVDPLDGTRQFIQHSHEFTVNIALIENHLPKIGLIYVPVTGECYYAEAKKMAIKLDAAGKITPLHTRVWQPDHTVMLTSHGAHIERLIKIFDYLGEFTQNKIASAWKFGLLAEGKGDISPRFGDTCEWDTAAGQCILEQAGGGIFNLSGQRLQYNTQPSLLNPHFIALGDYTAIYKIIWPSSLSPCGRGCPKGG